MTPDWRTSDGKVFAWENDARKHQDYLDGKTSTDLSVAKSSTSDNEKQRHCDAYNQIVKCYNAGDWDGVIKTFESDKDGTFSIRNLYPNTFTLVAIAMANRDGNYELAFRVTEWGKPYPSKVEILEKDKEYKMLFWELFDAGKKAWERKHGRALTDAELNKIKNQTKIRDCEASILSSVRGDYNKAFENLENEVPEWEELTGRAFTKEDEIRIYGKPFLKRGFSGKVKW